MNVKDLTAALEPRDGLFFLKVPNDPMVLEGLAGYHHDSFMRLPEDLYDQVNETVTLLANNTAGAALRFRTNSAKLKVMVESTGGGMMAHMALTGSAGCDIYVDNGFKATVFPNADSVCCGPYESEIALSGQWCDVRINFPLYNGVKKMTIGLAEEAEIDAPSPYAQELPMVFYGSSITQGGCASRPGNSYEAILSRLLNVGHINLGFSGSGRGEQNMAEYIASLPQSVFVMDYDHNAPDEAHLEKTHEAFFNTVRARNPELPIVIVTKPDFASNPEVNARRREIIRRTYQNALNKGDKNVYFVDGETLFSGVGADSCTVDGCHPNDLGFMRMALTLLPVLEHIFADKHLGL